MKIDKLNEYVINCSFPKSWNFLVVAGQLQTTGINSESGMLYVKRYTC